MYEKKIAHYIHIKGFFYAQSSQERNVRHLTGGENVVVKFFDVPVSPVVITLALVPVVIVILVVVVHKLPIIILVVVVIELEVPLLQRARHTRHAAAARTPPSPVCTDLYIVVIVI